MPIKWGFCCAGSIAHDFSRAMDAVLGEGHEKIAVAARDVDRAAKFAENNGFKRSYGDYTLLAQDKDVEIVYISSLSVDHCKHVKIFLDAGKHVLCEKPMTMNLKETEEVVEYAKGKSLLLMEAHWSRFNPIYQKMQSVVKSKELGEAQQVFCHFHLPAIYPERMTAKYGGTVTWDMGIYCVSLADLVFESDPIEVKSVGLRTEENVDKLVHMVLKYPGEKLATLSCGVRSPRPSTACVAFSSGFFEVKEPMHAPTDYEYTSCAGSEKKTSLVHIPMPETPKTDFSYANGQGFVYEIRHVKECLDKGLLESPVVPHKVTMRLAKIIDAALQQV